MSPQADNWQSVATLAGKATLGRPDDGCPNCGIVMHYTTETGQQAYWPGTECCPQAITRQIGWLHDEIADLKKRAETRNQHIRDLEESVELATTPGARAAAQAEVNRASHNLQQVYDDLYAEPMKERSSEIRRLAAKRRQMQEQEPPT